MAYEAESDVQCCHNADWARDLPEAAHVRAKLLEPVVIAPTPAHMYCSRLVLETLQEVRLAGSTELQENPLAGISGPIHPLVHASWIVALKMTAHKDSLHAC